MATHGYIITDKDQASPAVRTSYDQSNDVLYLALGDFKSEEEEFLETGVLLGFEEDGKEPKAATILRFSSRPESDRRRLADRLATLFHLPIRALGPALHVD